MTKTIYMTQSRSIRPMHTITLSDNEINNLYQTNTNMSQF